MTPPCKLSLEQWDERWRELRRQGLTEPAYGGPLGRHLAEEDDLRLRKLAFDSSTAALRLWNFLLTENRRLRQFRASGGRLVGVMKDLGTVPVMAYALPGVRAFYPDGAWWTPCLMECSDRLFQHADRLGIDASFCPVRAMIGAFETDEHFPRPDLLVCSAGAVCDDFSAIAQRLETLGYPIAWWEMPRRRDPDDGEGACVLPGGLRAAQSQVDWVREELERVGKLLGDLARCPLTETLLSDGIRRANQIRHILQTLRDRVYGSPGAPLPALEMLIAEMLAIHFCSDRDEAALVLTELLAETERRCRERQWVLPPDSVRVFWVNPVADLRAMNLLEEWGGRLCGADFMITHALEPIPEDLPPFEALARTALADPMVGSTQDRATRIIAQCRQFAAEAVIVSRIPGASHCAREAEIIRQRVRQELGLPVLDCEVPSLVDPLLPSLGSRLQALLETARLRRRR